MTTGDPSPATAALAQMSRRRKAALIVQLLLNDGNKLALSSLPEHVQEDLTRELGQIRLVDRATVQAVAGEFADLLESIGLSAPGGPGAALKALSEHISPALARKLQAQLDAQKGRDPWARILEMELEDLVPIFEAESLQVCAIVLSKLPVDRAAEVLGKLTGERARRVTFAVSQTEQTAPATLTRIGEALLADYGQSVATAFDKPPANRIGDILNSSPAATRDDLLTGLEESDSKLAKHVRKAIFTFEDIPTRLKPTDIPAVLRLVEQDVQTTALAYALSAGGVLTETAEHILANISQRMATQMREEAQELGDVTQAKGEKAMNAITAAIRGQVDAGAVTLIVQEDEAAQAA